MSGAGASRRGLRAASAVERGAMRFQPGASVGLPQRRLGREMVRSLFK